MIHRSDDVVVLKIIQTNLTDLSRFLRNLRTKSYVKDRIPKKKTIVVTLLRTVNVILNRKDLIFHPQSNYKFHIFIFLYSSFTGIFIYEFTI